jgi:hypothetical protein
METTLHRQLKDHYSGIGGEVEVPVGGYRIDIVIGRKLVEIQHSSLGSLRHKVRELLKSHPVEVIKPIIARKRLTVLDQKGGEVVSQRWSPKRGTRLDLFHELVYFTDVFPAKRLSLRVPLIEIEEIRFPFKRRNLRRKQFKVQDQQLLAINGEQMYRTLGDLCRHLPQTLPPVFGTGELADKMDVPRWFARRIAYCLREMGAASVAGKSGNSLLYQLRRGLSGKRSAG